MASKRQIDVGGVKIGGGAPVAVQSMTKTETADYDATLKQVHAISHLLTPGTPAYGLLKLAAVGSVFFIARGRKRPPS